MRFWQIKHADDPELAEKVLTIDDKDTYERTDNYNVYGLFCFFAIHMRNAFHEWKDINVPSILMTKAKY